MKKCLCGGPLAEGFEEREGVKLKGMRCRKCGEIYVPSSELVRFEILTGRRKAQLRKVRRIASSYVITLPTQVMKEDEIHENDYVLFEKTKAGRLIKVIHAHA
jgi:uncharacterized OB-fold protein